MIKILAVLLILLLSSCTQEKYITLNGWSYHTDRSRSWNEKNNINGLEIELSEEYNIEANTFINSFGNDSWIINISRIYPIPRNGTEFFSMKYGVADGYGTRIFPIFMPTLIKKFDYLKVELVVLPIIFILIVKIPI